MAEASDRYGDRYSERLWPTPGVWAAGLLFGASFGLVALPFGGALGALLAAVGVAAVAALLARSAAVVKVTDEVFVAGPARLPLEVVAAARPLDADGMRHARGVGADARAYLCLRGWLPAGVRVDLDDPADPTPYWLVSSRRPERLAAALDGARRG